jgi:predicted AlkP superfamily phosphohydrolase/phosphomutase
VEKQTRKVFIISLDGATFDVLRPLISQGYMPNLGRVLGNSLSAELESVLPPVTAPAWTSFMTGKNPNKHGIFDFTRFDTTEYRWKLNNSQHIRSKTIWQILSEKGKQIVVLNLPYLYPTYPVNGVMVAGWDAPTTSSFTYPDGLRKTIFDLIPDYGSTLDLSLWNYLPAESEAEFCGFIGKITQSFEQSARLASHFLRQEAWDVFMVHFQQTDWIQHKLWGYIERACRDAGDKHPRLERVRDCYRLFDSHVGRLWEEVGKESVIKLVLSDHGFGANRGTICPNYLLRKLGYFHLQEQSESGVKSRIKQSRYSVVRRAYQKAAQVRESLRARRVITTYKSWADMANERIPRQAVMIDWRRTKALLMGGSETAFIYVNLIDRGPQGCVNPSDYEPLVAELVQAFRELRDPRTNERLFPKVALGREVYDAPGLDVLVPDIVLIPIEGYGISATFQEACVQETGEEGSHRHNGVLLIEGFGLKEKIPDFQPNLVDVAPTILHMLGLAVPGDMDGRVWEEAFDVSTPATYEAVDNSLVHQVQDYTQDEAALIEERLRGLGYVE